jgi:hypothetical protein
MGPGSYWKGSYEINISYACDVGLRKRTQGSKPYQSTAGDHSIRNAT